jgi:hypothetical protein
MIPHHETLALLAENLRAIYVRLSAPILEDRNNRPKWTVRDCPNTPLTPSGQAVEELQDLIGIAATLERIVSRGDQESLRVVSDMAGLSPE